ncbi:hypothetical protein SynSYN20_00745 [Synechococcus sp. SYN20]|nr:hypothetical protein SynSYN20_00745 [Synechococcus sp. SYN20]
MISSCSATGPCLAVASVHGEFLFLPCLGSVHENVGQRLSAVLLAIVG